MSCPSARTRISCARVSPRSCARASEPRWSRWRTGARRRHVSATMKHRGQPGRVAQAACANDVVAVLMPNTELGGSRPAREAPPEMVRGDGASRTPRAIDAWWFADAVVVVDQPLEPDATGVSGGQIERRLEGQGPFPEQEPPRDRSGNRNGRTRRRSIRRPGTPTPRGARRFWSSQAFAKSPLAEDSLAAAATVARQLGPLGADSAFVIVQDCESARRRGTRAGAWSTRASPRRQGFVSKVARGRGGPFGWADKASRAWRAAWGRDRAARGARLRPGSRLRALLGELRDGQGRRRRRRAAVGSRWALKEAASASNRIGIDGRPLATVTRGRRGKRSRPHTPRRPSRPSAPSFERRSRVCRPAPAELRRREKEPVRLFFYFRAYAQLPAITDVAFVCSQGIRSRRARDVPVRSSAFEYAAGFFLSWTVPGPLAAHAAHFTNR